MISVDLLESQRRGRTSDRRCRYTETGDHPEQSGNANATIATPRMGRRRTCLNLFVDELADCFARGPYLIPTTIHEGRLDLIRQPDFDRHVLLRRFHRAILNLRSRYRHGAYAAFAPSAITIDFWPFSGDPVAPVFPDGGDSA
ncbi:hypothetical protein [Sphingomonas sp. Leaf343]|uniref:hypothetical protein n=1 Tax=Sphingomonas sp. Leaf343 TaxID=1736345 RepID=UPI0012E277FC|nr:hypothetical protein [Sphingomonas sp. Leaf343]